MNDFFLANNRTLPFPVLGTVVELKQFQVKDLDQWYAHADTVKGFLKNDYSDEILIQLLTKHPLPTMMTIEYGSGIGLKALLDLALKDQVEFLKLLNAVIQINQSFFKYEKQRPAKDSKSKSTWFDSFQLLISAGHTHDEIMKMSYGAFDQYLRAATRHQKRQMSLIRFAHHAEAKQFAKFADE